MYDEALFCRRRPRLGGAVRTAFFARMERVRNVPSLSVPPPLVLDLAVVVQGITSLTLFVRVFLHYHVLGGTRNSNVKLNYPIPDGNL